MHKRRWQRLLYINCAHLIRLTFNSRCRVYDFNIKTWQWFAGRSWFFRECFEAKIVGKYRASSLGLPIAIIDKFAFKMFLDPFECGDITTLSY